MNNSVNIVHPVTHQPNYQHLMMQTMNSTFNSNNSSNLNQIPLNMMMNQAYRTNKDD